MTDTLRILTPDAKIAEIKHLYYSTTKQTILVDLDRAVRLLKSMESEEERERAAVYMDGLSQMRSEWGIRPGRKAPGPKKRR
jgi:hypothetical protein